MVPLPVIAALTGALARGCFTLLALILVLRNDKRKRYEEARLRHLQRQIEELYGPLYGLIQFGAAVNEIEWMRVPAEARDENDRMMAGNCDNRVTNAKRVGPSMDAPFGGSSVFGQNLVCIRKAVIGRKAMKRKILSIPCRVILLLIAAALFTTPAAAQADLSASGKQLYTQIKSFSLGGGSATVSALVLNRDRAQMTFSGTFYFAAPVDGWVTGAVFVGNGKIRVEVPPSEFEKDNVKRLLGADVIESDFKTAVLRFSDDTFERLNQTSATSGGVVAGDASIQKLATEMDARILKETGANLAARVALSILNQEKPGFFFANFDGGQRGRFSLILDYQNRIPVANFDINAGEKGLILKYDSALDHNEVWMAFYGEDDYKRGTVSYSDVSDLIDVKHYDIDVDLREHKKHLRLRTSLKSDVLFPKLRAVSFRVGEHLPAREDIRKGKQMRLQQARLGQTELVFAQEDWEGGFTVFLPREFNSGENLDLSLLLEGDFMFDPDMPCDCHYPRSNESWFPRHGYLDRATFDLTFRHPKKLKVASVGKRVSEQPDEEFKDVVITKHQSQHPMALTTFALAPYKRHIQMVQWEKGGVGDPIPLEFNSLPGGLAAIKEDFIMAEMDNSLRYFTSIFGKYPYEVFGAAFHPFGFGQGFPTLLMIPATDRANKFTYSFIAHETAHQWWGDIVTWRSYRDQWLSEGFAEYSGILYTGLRDGAGSREDLINRARAELKDPPRTLTGLGKGRLVDVGPIILGHRLNTTKTLGAYSALIYAKGALVLRMLHFLFTDPATGNADPFFAMMTDFVNRHRNSLASTDDFRAVANEHFVKTPIAQRFQLKDLNWFFKQWVHQSNLPSYQLSYQLQDQPDGKVLLTGTMTQEHAPDDWFMVLPVGLTFGGKTFFTTAHAFGPKAEFAVKLPSRPSKVELDPQRWVLSENTSTKRN